MLKRLLWLHFLPSVRAWPWRRARVVVRVAQVEELAGGVPEAGPEPEAGGGGGAGGGSRCGRRFRSRGITRSGSFQQEHEPEHEHDYEEKYEKEKDTLTYVKKPGHFAGLFVDGPTSRLVRCGSSPSARRRVDSPHQLGCEPAPSWVHLHCSRH